ncbi:hypothetical protein [Pirellulimonas nuda]|uniref:hypothetical protein n=1 Tax=Pirellulimonas nuda TaxID=2528009 RepID=UPI001E4F680A|nr:hypothetical protein [Pirellulimonas nuda]
MVLLVLAAPASAPAQGEPVEVDADTMFLEVEAPAVVEAAEIKPGQQFQVEVRVQPAAEAPAEEGVNPQVLAMEQQLMPQFRSLLDGRLHGLRALCDLTPKQQTQLLEAGAGALERSVRAVARQQLGQQNGLVQIGVLFAGGRQTVVDPRVAVNKALDKAIAEVLTPEQLVVFKADAEKRAEFRKRAAARGIVSAIDQQLTLNADQRKRLLAALQEKWQEEWAGIAQMLQYGPQFLPAIPNGLIVPLLDAEQKQLWLGRVNHGHVSFDQAGFLANNNLRIEPFTPDGAEPQPADPAAPIDLFGPIEQ